MSEQKANYQTNRACFNCETGAMARTDHPEPGWYCKLCDTFLPDDQTAPRPGIDQAEIIQRLTFGDGSRITVKVEAPPGLIDDRATAAYYRWLLPALDRIEAEK